LVNQLVESVGFSVGCQPDQLVGADSTNWYGFNQLIV
jgi:hypothetical protein